MRRFVVVVTILLALAGPAAAEDVSSVGQAPCVLVTKRWLPAGQVRLRCHDDRFADSEITRWRKSGKLAAMSVLD